MVLRSQHYDDVYFSAQDGLAESTHVFLDGNDLPARFFALDGEFVIAESGFGTGLNFLAAWKLFEEIAPDEARMHFISFEKHPLDIDVILGALSSWHDIILSCHSREGGNPSDDGWIPAFAGMTEGGSGNIQDNNHISLSGQACLSPYIRIMENQYRRERQKISGGVYEMVMSDRVRLTLVIGDINDEFPKLDAAVDCWFLDGFRPASNPDMWSDVVFENMARVSRSGATFATFTAAGFVRRGLEAAGFEVRKVAGFGTKREMAVGVFR